MNNQHPLVSIAMPIYNGELTLSSAIQSIIRQTYQNWELFIIDDGSNDSSLEIAAKYNDDRIKIFHDGKNKGLPARLNSAIELSNGKFFCRMDQDDIAFPSRLEKQVQYLESNSFIDLVSSSVLVFRNDGSINGEIKVPLTHDEICKYPWKGFIFPHPAWMGRMTWFKENMYSINAHGAEDQLLLYATCRKSRFAGIPEILLGYREDQRTFKKLFGRRMVFWRVIAKNAIINGQIKDLFLLSIIQPLKIIADFLNVKVGVQSARNKLGSVDKKIEETWRVIWSNYNIK